MKPQYRYRGTLRRVVDGDTIDLQVDLGFHVLMRLRFRLKDIDTPEIYGRKKDSTEYEMGIKAKEFVEKRFAKNDGECIIESTKTGVYGRWLGDIFFPDSEESLNDELLKEGFAEKYRK